MYFSNTLLVNKETLYNEVATNIFRKLCRMKNIEIKKGLLSDEDIYLNIKTAFKSAIYMYYRFLLHNPTLLNKVAYSAVYYFIRNFAYSSMFRYNRKGEFNVPYGGMGYNKNNLTEKIKLIKNKSMQERLKNTIIENVDFYDFLSKKSLDENDFIFLDPPYDTEFNTYDQNQFIANDQKRLADLLINLKAKWMLVIKNTDFIHSLYDNKENIFINYFDKSYSVSFMNRNDKKTEHLIITNYNVCQI